MKRQKGFSLIGILIIIGALILTMGGSVVWQKGVFRFRTTPEEATSDGKEGTLENEIIEVKFVEGSGVRLREGKLVSLTGQNLNPVYALLNQYPVLKIERLFTAPEEELEAMKKPGVDDLNLWYRITLEGGADTEGFIERLKRLEVVDKAEPAPLPHPPPGM